MTHPGHGQPVPLYQLPPTAAAVKPRNRAAAVALILALLAWLAAALGIWLIVASHPNGCHVDKPLLDAGSWCVLLGGLLNAGAGVTGLVSRGKPSARGAYRTMGVAAMVMGGVGVMILLVFFIEIPVRNCG